MINLLNDYSLIAHDKILEKIMEYKDNYYKGYGTDELSLAAKEEIKKACGNENIEIEFLPGGTITNKVAIGHLLKPYEAVICCDTGHINVHETAAIEQTGHKIIAVKNENGKITKEAVRKVLNEHLDEHMVKPRLVYISLSTEIGTVYTKDEIKELFNICHENDLYLYLDGARLASGLNSKYTDLTLKDVTKYTDLFYIGGTKNGLMYGEALIIVNPVLKENIRYSIKHFGGMISKGFLTGLQFKTLFTDDLFNEIGKYENELAYLFSEKLESLNLELFSRTESNQIFVNLPYSLFNYISDKILCEVFSKNDHYLTVRFVTNFKTTKEEINQAVEIIKKGLNNESRD